MVVYACTALMMVSCGSFVAIERSGHDYSDSAFIAYLKGNDIPYTKNNDVEILNGAHAKFQSLLNDIANARHHIHLEYFNFRNDSINKVLIEALVKKAKEGVEVRAMFDAFGNMSNDSPLRKKDLESIRANGIQIVKFDPIRFPWVNHVWARDHRKIVVIDGEIGYIGGINVADYYLHGIEGIGEWRDIHAKVTGEAVNELQRVFLATWEQESGEHVDGEKYYPQHQQNNGADIAIIDRWPHKTPERMRYAYANAIHSAKDSITLINPYFMPMPIVSKALKKAIDDGVKVTIILSAKGDVKAVPDAVWREGYKLMKHGAQVYMYEGGFNHAKVMCIDGKFCTIGSANLNSRSLMYDYETNIFIFGEEDTEELQRYIDLDKQRCFRLTKEIYKQRPCWNRLLGWLVCLIKPVM